MLLQVQLSGTELTSAAAGITLTRREYLRQSNIKRPKLSRQVVVFMTNSHCSSLQTELSLEQRWSEYPVVIVYFIRVSSVVKCAYFCTCDDNKVTKLEVILSEKLV